MENTMTNGKHEEPKVVESILKSLPGNILVRSKDLKQVTSEDFNQITFKVNNGNINISIVNGEIQVHCDGKLKITPWSSNSIRLNIEDGEL